MGYKDLYQSAVTSKTVRELMPAFFQFKTEGDSVVGRLLSRSSVTSRKSGGEYIDYVVDTDDGAVHFGCGGQFDSKVGPSLVEGKIYAWTFNGKRDVGGGRRVNDFAVQEIPDPMAPDAAGRQGNLPL